MSVVTQDTRHTRATELVLELDCPGSRMQRAGFRKLLGHYALPSADVRQWDE